MRRDQTAHESLIPLLVEIIGARCYLELGVYDFTTIRKVREQNPDCRCIGVDSKRIGYVPPGIEFFHMTTKEFFGQERGIRPDLVFIDADHNAFSVQDDATWSWEILSGEGLMLLHDTNPETVADTAPGLCGNAWEYAKAMEFSEAVTLPYHPGLTIIRKRMKWGPMP